MFRLSISNISWPSEDDMTVYSLMQKLGFTGLEIAPTRIFPLKPYEHIQDAHTWARSLYENYGFSVPSIQSIWYGKTERLFGAEQERLELLSYTRKAIDFAEAIGCRNLVFGCPKNRIIPQDNNDDIAVEFFRLLGDYACEHDTIIGMEANPVIYGTNYINTTEEARDLVRRVGSDGFKLNLDIGTMIYNNESISVVENDIASINHVQISEPSLKAIQERDLHHEIKYILTDRYDGFVSIEMRKDCSLEAIQSCMSYVKEIFQ